MKKIMSDTDTEITDTFGHLWRISQLSVHAQS